MAFSNEDRPSYDVDLECARCGSHISKLPFQPTDPTRKVFCEKCNREYWQNKRQTGGGNFGGGSFERRPRQKFAVDINCAKCGTHISELPFEPKEGGRDVLCVTCLRAERGR